ncbi:uncharacterized protein LAESUDRAFT_729551 [Laetiporus sulphureus 93-53]|uniref:Peptidase M48 domain-containing protein n=1 Tax=Laetiporus sulphureus 93-53 TaxID=1314785 RepID=A0A165CLW6_9APHY|nr:uncharacterized protein LAESUDRAFT_729551 [Laetiporus sulphureus 93-53]KZT03044.1 hypothetical protein LAESUDRAFT_729551 [Laetiporus sulphureus 93-53]
MQTLSSLFRKTSVRRISCQFTSSHCRTAVQQTQCRQLSSHSPRRAPRYVRFQVDPDHPFDVSRWNLQMKVVVGVLLGGGVYYVVHLEQVPETGRWRFMDVSPKFEAKLAKTAHDQLLLEYKGKTLPPNHPITRHVRRVATRILESSGLGTLESEDTAYLHHAPPRDNQWLPTSHAELPPGIEGKEWNLMVVNDDRVPNAMCVFRNIVVFTGILPVAKDDAGLAAVLGHEIGHVVERHVIERYSSMKVLLFMVSMLVNVIGVDIGLAQLLSSIMYTLPNTRKQEFEADEVGLKLIAKACYDPAAATEMFKRLGQLDKSEDTEMIHMPFLKTHPPSEARVQRLEALLPTAYQIQAESSACNDVQDSLTAFRQAFVQRPFGSADETAIWGWA